MRLLWTLCFCVILSCSKATPRKTGTFANRERIARQANNGPTELSEADLNALLANAFGDVGSTTTNPPSAIPTTYTGVDNTLSEEQGGSNSRPRVPVPPRGPEGTEGTEDVEGDCECVPYYLCNTNRTIIENGEGLIDIRLKGDCDYLEVCCSTGETLPPSQPITPSPPPIIPTPPSSQPTSPSFPSQPTSPSFPSQPTSPSFPSQPTSPSFPSQPTFRPVPLADSCGKRNPEGVGFRITGAEDSEAQFAEFPWMVAVIKKDVVNEQQTLNVYQCGGSLIHPQVVLTAAHCVQGKTGLTVRAGEWDTQRTNEPLPTQNRPVREVVIHEEYYPGALFNDVALLFLDTAVNLAPNVGLICLPEQGENMDNRQCVASGWGKDVFGREGKYQVILKKVELPTVPRARCLQELQQTRLGGKFKLHPSFLCAGGTPGQDTCRGDGGSPLVCPSRDNPDVYVQAGIVAWGIGCGTETPGVYVDVAKFSNWIENKLSIFNIDPKTYNRGRH